MKRKDANEIILIDAYEEQINKAKLDFIIYENFDFHENKGQCNPIVKKYYYKENQKFDFFCIDLSLKENNIFRKQHGVFRVNC